MKNNCITSIFFHFLNWAYHRQTLQIWKFPHTLKRKEICVLYAFISEWLSAEFIIAKQQKLTAVSMSHSYRNANICNCWRCYTRKKLAQLVLTRTPIIKQRNWPVRVKHKMREVLLLSSVDTVWSYVVNATTDARGKKKSLVMAERRRRKVAEQHWIWCVSDMILINYRDKFGCVINERNLLHEPKFTHST